MSPLDENAFKFLKKYKGIRDIFGTLVEFNPHWVVFTNKTAKFLGFGQNNSNCVSGGRYCAPDVDKNGSQTGKDVIMEILRQMCINEDYEDLFLDYAVSFYENKCFKSSNISNCSWSVIDSLNIPRANITKCINESFKGNNSDIDDNKLLKEERDNFSHSDVVFWPTAFINGINIKGSITKGFSFMSAICEAFTNKPAQCRTEDIIHKSKSDVWAIVVFVLAILFAIYGAVWYLA